jgi:glycosyltransferase involved in cell wall biosynthesis
MEMPRLLPESRTWPPVSAIVATSGRPELLARAVRGILGQTYPGEVECMVVFDQITPVTLLVDVPARRGLRVVSNTRTPGLAGARNTGITASRGALIAFCDDASVWAPDK